MVQLKPLSAEDKTASIAARKRANTILDQRRVGLSFRIREETSGSLLKTPLHAELEATRDVKGLPVILLIEDSKLVVNYEFLATFLRKLRKRRVTVELIPDSDKQILRIKHFEMFSRDKNFGTVELYELPQYQRELLIDLPVVDASHLLVR